MDSETIIYTSEPSTDMVDDIMQENPGMQSDTALMLAYEKIQEDRERICHDFDDIHGHFVIYGSAGLWDGHHGGFTPLMDSTLGEALEELTAGLRNTDSVVRVKITDAGDITATKAHHDGTNYYVLRELDHEYDDDELEAVALEGAEAYFEKHAKPCAHYVQERWGLNLSTAK